MELIREVSAAVPDDDEALVRQQLDAVRAAELKLPVMWFVTLRVEPPSRD